MAIRAPIRMSTAVPPFTWYNAYKRVPLINIANIFIPSKQNNNQASNQYRLTRPVSLMEQELFTPLELLSSPRVFSGVRVTSIFRLICMFCRSLFVLLYFFFWPLCCQFFYYYWWILITSLVSLSSSLGRSQCVISLAWAEGFFTNLTIPH